MCVCVCVCVCTCMRAAALGSEELMSTGWEISMLCLLFSWAVLCVTLRAVNEWRFLAFFFPSPRRWGEGPPPGEGEGLGEGPGEQGPNGGPGDGSELGPGTGAGLSISISCLAVSFSCEGRGGQGKAIHDSASSPSRSSGLARCRWPLRE